MKRQGSRGSGLHRSHGRRGSPLAALCGLAWIGAGLACSPARHAPGAQSGHSPESTGAPAAAKQEPAPKMSSRKAIALAREALKADNPIAALGYYDLVLENDRDLDEKRAEALFMSGMLSLSRDAGLRDTARARERLAKLAEQYSDEPDDICAKVALDLLGDTERLQSEKEKISADRLADEDQWKKEKEDLQQKLKSAEEASQEAAKAALNERQSAAATQSQLAGEKQQLEALLAEKDAALQDALKRVKRAFVRQGSARGASAVKTRDPAAPPAAKPPPAGATEESGKAQQPTEAAGGSSNGGAAGNKPKEEP